MAFLNLNFLFIGLIIIIIFDLVILILFLIYSRKLRAIFYGKQAKDLEDIIYQINEKVELNSSEIAVLNQNLNKLFFKFKSTIQAIGLVRFRAFNDVGGDQSFALAFLDENLNGVVISGIYSREGVRVYSKAIENGVSKYNLSNEEIEAVKVAINKIPK